MPAPQPRPALGGSIETLLAQLSEKLLASRGGADPEGQLGELRLEVHRHFVDDFRFILRIEPGRRQPRPYVRTPVIHSAPPTLG